MTDDLPSPRLPVARGALPWLAPAASLTAALALRARRSPRWAAAAGFAASGTAALTWFFRDPDRPKGSGRVLAAADGVVQGVDRLPDGRTRVATFMSPLDVHVNRAPLAGIVLSVRRHPGGHRPAFDKDSDRNERVVWRFDTEIGEVDVVQIAGTLARRIVPYVEAGSKVEQAERIGLIRLGSRVDVYLPSGVTCAVAVGQRTRAGQTRLDRD